MRKLKASSTKTKAAFFLLSTLPLPDLTRMKKVAKLSLGMIVKVLLSSRLSLHMPGLCVRQQAVLHRRLPLHIQAAFLHPTPRYTCQMFPASHLTHMVLPYELQVLLMPQWPSLPPLNKQHRTPITLSQTPHLTRVNTPAHPTTAIRHT